MGAADARVAPVEAAVGSAQVLGGAGGDGAALQQGVEGAALVDRLAVAALAVRASAGV